MMLPEYPIASEGLSPLLNRRDRFLVDQSIWQSVMPNGYVWTG